MVDCVVDFVANMLDYWGSGNMDSSRCSNMVSSRGSNMVSGRDNSWGSLHFNSLDLSNSWGSNSWGSNSEGRSSIAVSSSRNHSMGKWCSMSNSNSGSWGSSIDTSYQAMSISKVLSLSLSISSRGSKAAGNKGENNKALSYWRL
eukprot:TRINITY_DN3522_c0_g1_i4.p1 TRINITY_DN3522_c0_g1~~TRINITY_DN3522_c0_g1_i4.p1  ORF type:complete len:145 (+),score=39.37 TRINITY_DN3522_c0_g1_i4:189-623(+)